MNDATATRRLRVQGIRDAATVCAALGQAHHELTPSGQHRVSIHGRTATAETLQGAIEVYSTRGEHEHGHAHQHHQHG